MKKYLLILCICITISMQSQDLRWHLHPSGGIEWTVDNKLPHYDHIEMSGEQISAILRYGVNGDGSFSMERSLVWPMLRTIPNNTHASLLRRVSIHLPSLIMANGLALRNERVTSIRIDGTLTVTMQYTLDYYNLGVMHKAPEVEISATFFPSTTQPHLCELYVVRNIAQKQVNITIPSLNTSYETEPEIGVQGSYTIQTDIAWFGTYRLAPGDSAVFTAIHQAYSEEQYGNCLNVREELKERQSFVQQMWSELVFDSPDEVINRMFAFSKIRATESIYRTQGGLMHGPGGEDYYAAIWANDQGEYVNPFFPFLGYDTGNESAINSYRHFARFMNDTYEPIPSSIISEGIDIWNGAGDRGDAAMIAYGAARYALARADRAEAEELWKLITWCLEYCKRKLNNHGVVNSDTDELEERFPSGNANLCTSSLYYDALTSAGYLANALYYDKKIAQNYEQEAVTLRKNMENFFGAKVQGFDTYRYYEENDLLRSWICMPLCVNIFDRKEATIEALFSPYLWTENGLLTQAGSETFWDRSTLYALRGVFAANATKKAISYLSFYSNSRLLGEHVPYAIEAWPEGSQRHLSGESALFARIITEGLFHIRPTGFNSFQFTPHLPAEWDYMSLKNIHAFGGGFDIHIKRIEMRLEVTISKNGKVILKKKISENEIILFTDN